MKAYHLPEKKPLELSAKGKEQVGWNACRDEAVAVKVDVEKLDNLIYDEDIIEQCPNCGGIGYCGHWQGKKISCETCGGHEDSLGRGFIYDVDRLATAIEQGEIFKEG